MEMWAFCCIPNSGVFKNMHFCTFLLNFFKTNYCFVAHKKKPQSFRIVSIFKSLFEKMHTTDYFKMRKISTGANFF